MPADNQSLSCKKAAEQRSSLHERHPQFYAHCRSYTSFSSLITASSLYLVLILAACLPRLSIAFDLITVAEALQSDQVAESDTDLVAKSSIDGPMISVIQPDLLSGILNSPINFEVLFEPAQGTDIDQSSLRIYYVKLFKKDITNRLLKHAHWSGSRLLANEATLPAGEHKFLVEIKDSFNRIGSELFTLKIAR